MNEEINLENWEVEFDRRINGDNYKTLDGVRPFGNQYLAPDQDNLLCENAYPESEWEMDGDKIKAFIKSLLAAKDTHYQKELEIADARWKRAEQYIAKFEGETLP